MTTKEYGGQTVNPSSYDNGYGVHLSYEGMTLREHFAGLAMQGMLADGCLDYEILAESAVEYADALLAALNKGEKEGEK